MNPSQWMDDHGNFAPIGATTPKIEPGIYMPLRHFTSFALHPISPKSDTVISLGVANHVFNEIQAFWKSESNYRNLGFLHKRNFLLYGPPGTGKSITLRLISEAVKKEGGIAIVIGGEYEANLMPSVLLGIRHVQPTIPVVCCWEDIEQHCSEAKEDEFDPDTRAMMTALLDGHNQVNNVCHIGTTNHIEKIDSAYRNRPGRFDEVLYVGAPDREVRIQYLKSVVPNGDPAILNEIADKTDGFMLAHLRDTLVSCLIHKHPVDNVIKRIVTTMGLDAKIKADKEEKAKNAAPQSGLSASQLGKSVTKALAKVMG